jgi:hypothetical protein
MGNVTEPLRSWPSGAAIAAHGENGGLWLCERKKPLFGKDVRIGHFYCGGLAFKSYSKSYEEEFTKFGPVDNNYNRLPWPKDKEGNPL